MLELVVVAPLEAVRVGDRFERGRLPLHLTTVPKFRLPEGNLAAAFTVIGAVASTAEPLDLTTSGYDWFGHAADVQVTTVERSPELCQLHLRLLDAVRGIGAVPFEDAYTGDGYRPHITHTRGGHAVAPGNSVRLTALAVLDCTRPARQVCAAWSLSGVGERSVDR